MNSAGLKKDFTKARYAEHNGNANHIWHVDGYDKLSPYGFTNQAYIAVL